MNDLRFPHSTGFTLHVKQLSKQTPRAQMVRCLGFVVPLQTTLQSLHGAQQYSLRCRDSQSRR